MRILPRGPSKEDDGSNEPQRLPLRWALIGLAAVGVGIAAGLPSNPAVGILAGAGLAATLHKILN